MVNALRGEIWKTVAMNEAISPGQRLEVSNYGRVRTFNKLSKGKVIKGSMINGYPIIKLKLFSARTSQTENKLKRLRLQILHLQNSIRGGSIGSPANANAELKQLKAMLRKVSAEDLKSRTIYYQALIHRLVAEHFLNRPGQSYTIVSHLDYDKQHNDFRNLKWMTPEESKLHQQKSPQAAERKNSLAASTNAKLTVTRVMLLKKLLEEDKPIKNLAKQFKITETQVLRIKRGENWGKIPAAR